MKDINLTVSGNIRKFRKDLGYTQETPALKTGLHRAYIAQIGRYEKSIGLFNLEKIVLTSNINIKDFFDD